MTTENNEFRVKLLTAEGKVPFIATEYSAGYDLFAPSSGSIPAGGREKVNLGISIEIPKGYYGQIYSRSSLAYKHGIITLGGVIDSDYRGELSVLLYNTSQEPFTYQANDRIAQMVIHSIFTAQPILTNTLTTTTRSSGGFGSTGK
ncbi:dUTP pyrophosphatase [Nematocida sp. AWRm80]|nr:dUTP pyrophosphatase [Nematocida sp. AWRm80]